MLEQADYSSFGAFMENCMERQKHNYNPEDDTEYIVDSVIAVKRHPHDKDKFLFLATFEGCGLKDVSCLCCARNVMFYSAAQQTRHLSP